jgi:hypothetical protein
METTWKCTCCNQPPSDNLMKTRVNTMHPAFKLWKKRGLRLFCWRCMKNTKQVVVERD